MNEIHPQDVTIGLLADYPNLVDSVAEMRWLEWANGAEHPELQWWEHVTRRESGRNDLPVTWVAVDRQGKALGAVGLALFDLEEIVDRSPWLIGMIVLEQHRSQGVGGMLVSALLAYARSKRYESVWVATGGRAVEFYVRNGWRWFEQREHSSGEATILVRRVLATGDRSAQTRMKPHRVRQAVPADVPKLYQLDHIARDEEERRSAIDRAIDDGCCTVVERNADVLGYGIISHEFFGRSFLDLIYIGEEHRGQGLGPTLIRALEQQSRSASLFTSTNQSNLHMQHVLANLGFEPSGIIHNLDPGDPELVYVKHRVSRERVPARPPGR